MYSTRIEKCCVLILLAAGVFLAASAQAQPTVIGQHRQLFVDDAMIAERSNVSLRLHNPTKHPTGPVILPDQPWEVNSVAIYGSVIYDEQESIFKAWYRAIDDTCYAAYATSADGVHWTKPELGVKSHQGSTANNIVLGGPGFYLDGFSVIKDANDPDPNRRYKMLTYAQIAGGGTGAAAMVSPDGIHWSGPINAPLASTGDVISMYYDDGLDKYVGLLKQYIGGKRSRTISYSDDFVTWTAPTTLMTPDAADGPTAHLYSHVGYMYQGMRLGYVSVLDTSDEIIRSQLVSSRDGMTWQRYRERTPFIENGAAGEFDSGMLIPGASGLVERDGKIYIYYTGYNVDHEGNLTDPNTEGIGAIGLATLRQDGFVSVSAGLEAGTLLTQQFILSGDQLLINADATGGSIRAELLDENGNPISGYDLNAALTFTGDSLSAPLGWQVAIDPALIGQAVQLRFHLQEADLYSFSIANVPEPTTLGLLGTGALALLRRRK